MSEEQSDAQQEAPQQPAGKTVDYDKFSRVVQAKRNLEAQVAELREQNQALEEKASSIDLLAQQLQDAQGRVAQAEQRFTDYQAISGAVGTTDAEVIEAFEWQYSRLDADRPALGEWITGMRSDPSKAPAVLRPWLATEEPKAEKPARRASPSASHKQPAAGQSEFSEAEFRTARAELLNGRPEKWLQMRKALGMDS